MESVVTQMLSIAGAVCTALLTWIGWLIKKRVDDSKVHLQTQEELKLLISQFIDSQEILLSVSAEIVSGLKIALQADALQLKNAHETGLMNGESLEHLRVINDYMKNIEDMPKKLEQAKVQRAHKG